MTTIAIHQPNYLPWLGYFAKIAGADAFVFLDDVQFSKNSYTNRVKILARGDGRWLTVPVSIHIGQPINVVRPATADWVTRHLDALSGFYRRARAFREVWPRLESIFGGLPATDISRHQSPFGRGLGRRTQSRVPLRCLFGHIDVGARTGDDRLVALTAAIDPKGIYLSGRGGKEYQSERKFDDAGLNLRYTDVEHPVYDQGDGPFVAGLSVVDTIFHLGWAGTSDLIDRAVRSS